MKQWVKIQPEHPVAQAWAEREPVPYQSMLRVALGACLEYGTDAELTFAALSYGSTGLAVTPDAPLAGRFDNARPAAA